MQVVCTFKIMAYDNAKIWFPTSQMRLMPRHYCLIMTGISLRACAVLTKQTIIAIFQTNCNNMVRFSEIIKTAWMTSSRIDLKKIEGF